MSKMHGNSAPDVEENHVSQLEKSLDDVVEQIGFGPAQLRVFFLATGLISLSDGIEITAMNMLNPAITSEFGVGVDKRASVAVISTAGMVLGSLFSGYFGDRYGRRPLILSALLILGMFQPFAALTRVFPAFVACRFAGGFGAGLAVNPSVGLLSEITPRAYRLPMRAATLTFFSLGSLLVALSLWVDAPFLDEPHWRFILVGSGFLPALAFITVGWSSNSILLESPAFLMSVGRRAEATDVLKRLAELNGHSITNAALELSFGNNVNSVAELSLWDQVAIIFSRRHLLMTIGVMYTAASLGLSQFGAEYALPIILQEAGSIPPAKQICMMTGYSLLFAWLSLAIVMRMRHTRALALSMFIGCILLSALAFAGSHPPPRSRRMEAMFRCTNLMPLAYTMGRLVLLQVAVQLYPTTASMTGSALILACQRIAGLGAPIAFESSRGSVFADDDETWTLFFYCCGASLGCGAVLMQAVSFSDNSDQGTAGESLLASLQGNAALAKAGGVYGATLAS